MNKQLTALLLLISTIAVLFFANKAFAVTAPSGVPTEQGQSVKLEVPNTSVTVTGCASPNALVSFYVGNTPAGTTIASNNGSFSKTIVVDSFGLHNIRAFYDDANGRTSSTVSQIISLSAHKDTGLNLLMPTTIEHEPEPVPRGAYLIFRGSTCPYALVNVIINGNFTLAAKADDRGNWYVIADTSNYYIGRHIYEALSAVGSQVSPKTQKYIFTTIGKNPFFSGEGELIVPPIITSPANNYLSGSKTVTISGKGPINSQIEIYLDDVIVGSVFTNPFGEWSFSLELTQPNQTITARSCNQSGCSEKSEPITISYSGNLDNCSLDFSLGKYRYSKLQVGDGVDIRATISNDGNYDALIDWGDSNIEHFSLNSAGHYSYHHVYSSPGQFNGSFTIKDDSGCTYTRYFSVFVTPSKGFDLLILVWFVGGLATGATARAIQNRLQKDKASNLPPPQLPRD